MKTLAEERSPVIVGAAELLVIDTGPVMFPPTVREVAEPPTVSEPERLPVTLIAPLSLVVVTVPLRSWPTDSEVKAPPSLRVPKVARNGDGSDAGRGGGDCAAEVLADRQGEERLADGERAGECSGDRCRAGDGSADGDRIAGGEVAGDRERAEVAGLP